MYFSDSDVNDCDNSFFCRHVMTSTVRSPRSFASAVVSVSTSRSRDVPTSRLGLGRQTFRSRLGLSLGLGSFTFRAHDQFPDEHADGSVRSVNGL